MAQRNQISCLRSYNEHFRNWSVDLFFSSHFCVSQWQLLQGLGTQLQMIFQTYQYWHDSIPAAVRMLGTELEQFIIWNANKAKAAPTAVQDVTQMQHQELSGWSDNSKNQTINNNKSKTNTRDENTIPRLSGSQRKKSSVCYGVVLICNVVDFCLLCDCT